MSTVRSVAEELCGYCEELLGSVSVETIAGKKLHPDCWDKWKRDVAAESVIKRGALVMKDADA